MEDSNSHVTPLKKVCGAHISPLEALPQDVLVIIIIM
jgi:hypothetical protein